MNQPKYYDDGSHDAKMIDIKRQQFTCHKLKQHDKNHIVSVLCAAYGHVRVYGMCLSHSYGNLTENGNLKKKS